LFNERGRLVQEADNTNKPEKTTVSRGNIIKVVWINLLDNAIKFTPSHGQIQIELTNTLVGLVVKIKDTGIGMTEEEQIRIFERFYKRTAHVIERKVAD
jgi:signal transduction histidine kinase